MMPCNWLLQTRIATTVPSCKQFSTESKLLDQHVDTFDHSRAAIYVHCFPLAMVQSTQFKAVGAGYAE